MANKGFDVLQREIAAGLGFPEWVRVPYLADNGKEMSSVRVPAPNAEDLDYLPPDQTKDVVGVGETAAAALVSMFLEYHRKLTELDSITGDTNADTVTIHQLSH